jgi:DNA polymerase I-like protein with 3'-5' exonuclease and polymerase domains
MVNKRISQLAEGKEAWLKRVEEDGRIHGYVNTNGAVTGRMTHSRPNVAQVPANDAPYGEECRELFMVPKGRKLVGCDAAGLELRMLAHYMFPYDNGEYAQAVLHGRKEDGTDAHTMNAKALGKTRSEGKTWFYGFIYGAGNKLLGGGDPSKGQRLRAKFLRNLPALKRLINDVQQKIRDTMDKEEGIPGRLNGLDGRPLYSRSLHSSLNLLLQSAGAVLMKQALVIADRRLDKTRCEFVGNIHDEFQVESDADYAETCGQILRQSIIDAGEHFKLNVPMDGEYAIGDSWKETH